MDHLLSPGHVRRTQARRISRACTALAIAVALVMAAQVMIAALPVDDPGMMRGQHPWRFTHLLGLGWFFVPEYLRHFQLGVLAVLALTWARVGVHQWRMKRELARVEQARAKIEAPDYLALLQEHQHQNSAALSFGQRPPAGEFIRSLRVTRALAIAATLATLLMLSSAPKLFTGAFFDPERLLRSGWLGELNFAVALLAAVLWGCALWGVLMAWEEWVRRGNVREVQQELIVLRNEALGELEGGLTQAEAGAPAGGALSISEGAPGGMTLADENAD